MMKAIGVVAMTESVIASPLLGSYCTVYVVRSMYPVFRITAKQPEH